MIEFQQFNQGFHDIGILSFMDTPQRIMLVLERSEPIFMVKKPFSKVRKHLLHIQNPAETTDSVLNCCHQLYKTMDLNVMKLTLKKNMLIWSSLPKFL